MLKKNLLTLLIASSSINLFSQTKIYFDILTHNEDSFAWSTTGFYQNNRSYILNLANYCNTNGISWNMQSDVTYLTSVLNPTNETPALMGLTGGKNILRYMHEDLGVEMDPHGHEVTYIYPDLVKLMDSIGLPESKIMGGSLYKEMNGMNVWTNLVNGQYGNIFPTFFWEPDYIMGGGTPMHVADLNYYGVWNPKDTANYLVHDTSSHLRHLGTGCEIKIHDTSSVSTIMAKVHELVNNVADGTYPANKLYFQTIFIGQGDLINATFYNKVVQIIDSINTIVLAGDAEWKTMKEAYTEWETTYSADMFQWNCGQVSSEIDEINNSTINVYPNPVTSQLTIELNNYDSNSKPSMFIYDINGKCVYQSNLTFQTNTIYFNQLMNGVYHYTVNFNNHKSLSGKVIKL